MLLRINIFANDDIIILRSNSQVCEMCKISQDVYWILSGLSTPLYSLIITNLIYFKDVLLGSGRKAP